MSESLGLPFMPWQRQVADVIGEFDPVSGLPSHRTVAVTVPRQSGKTSLMLAVIVHRALFWGREQRIAYTAQTGLDAKNKMKKDWLPLLKGSQVRAAIAQTWVGMAETAILFKGGSRVDAVNTSESSGHGMVLDLAIVDEAFADEDYRREQALRPAMVTRPDAQLIVISTAGTEKSVYLKQLVDTGRDAATNDGQGFAYFEWSAEDDADSDDTDVWYSCMPALGVTQSVDTIRADRQALEMSDGEFRRAYLNQWTVSDDRVIPLEVWRAVLDAEVSPDGGLVFAADASPDRRSASIAVCDSQGRAEVVDVGPGVEWLRERTAELCLKHEVPVVVDGSGPAASIVAQLRARQVRVAEYGAAELADACGRFYDLVADGLVRIRPRDVLERAAAGAIQRTVGDRWAWGRRKSDVDISPLVAVTLAVGEAFQPAQGEGPFVYSLD